MSIRKPDVKRPPGRLSHKWKDDVKIDLKEMGCEDVDWVSLAWGSDQWWAVVNVVMNLQDP
jgi:hypothetical protein